MCNCDELSLSGLDMVSPFNDMPESIGPSIDCGREFEPSICNQAWNLKWVNIESLMWCELIAWAPELFSRKELFAL